MEAIELQGHRIIDYLDNQILVERIIQKGEKEETFTFKYQDKLKIKGYVEGFIVESNNLK